MASSEIHLQEKQDEEVLNILLTRVQVRLKFRSGSTEIMNILSVSVGSL